MCGEPWTFLWAGCWICVGILAGFGWVVGGKLAGMVIK